MFKCLKTKQKIRINNKIQINSCKYNIFASLLFILFFAITIFKILSFDNKVKIRPHPLHMNMKLLLKYFDEKLIEKPDITDIYTSLYGTRNVVSIGSSVLYQAYLLGISVVIDDVTNVDRFNYFKENNYIMFNKEHKLLSEILNK